MRTKPMPGKLRKEEIPLDRLMRGSFLKRLALEVGH